MRAKRAIILVFDGVGAGALPDADRYGDAGSNTLANTARAVGGLALPTLQQLGLGNIIEIDGVPPATRPQACFGRMAEVSAGKDTTAGHWEMMGLWLEKPFPVYPDGFPPDVISEFQARIGRPVLGNKPASGTEIIKELGEEHLRTGRPIVYTSADSVFQIAAHEKVVPLEELYRWCETARSLLVGANVVDRVIARPFVGEPGAFARTEWRRDFGLPPIGPTVLDHAAEAGVPVWAVGKIGEVFCGRGITESVHTANNGEVFDRTIDYLHSRTEGIIFANLVDFDMLWGHRNNAPAYARGLEDADERLPELLALVVPGDVVFLTADHGCDPTTASTDHSREYVPLLALTPGGAGGVDLGVRRTFADLGKTVADALGFDAPVRGESFWSPLVGNE